MSTMYASLMPDLVGIDLTPDQGATLTARHGFAGFDLRLTRHLDWIESWGVERLRDHLENLKLRPGYASMLTRTLAATDDEWNAMIDRLPRIARVAQRLGYTRAGVVVLPFDDRLDFPANRKRHISRLAQCGPLLADHDICVGLEYVAPLTRRADAAFTFVHDLAGMRQLLADAAQPNAGLMLDSFHWHCARESVADLTALRAQDVVVVHINDAPRDEALDTLDVRRRELPGETGVIDLAGFMGGLATIGYAGPVTAEPTHDRWPDTEASVAARLTAHSVRQTLALVGT